jgi:ABC-type Mn2+/Zn2+ transport system permease subunit
MVIQNLEIFAVGLAVASAAAILGNFVILQRLSLAADVLSHIALPGFAIALALHVNPFLGGLAFLLFAALFIWRVEQKTHIPLDAIIGVLFTASLAVGALMFKDKEQLLEALFGNLKGISIPDVVFGISASIIIIFVVWTSLRAFTLSLLSPEFALSLKIPVPLVRLLFLILLVLTVAVGIKVVGVLLVGGLLLLPPLTAARIARGLPAAIGVSFIVSAIGVLAGILLSSYFNLEPGPLILLTETGLYLVALLLPQKR